VSIVLRDYGEFCCGILGLLREGLPIYFQVQNEDESWSLESKRMSDLTLKGSNVIWKVGLGLGGAQEWG
jgi:hypothetical protein